MTNRSKRKIIKTPPHLWQNNHRKKPRSSCNYTKLEFASTRHHHAFLHGYLVEVYMRPREGYKKAKEGHVCKYGLGQASREWNVVFSKFLKNFGMKQSKIDYCFFTKVQNGKTTMVLVYVHDLIIIGNDEECIAVLKQFDKAFTIKDLELMRYFLGLKSLKILKETCWTKENIFMFGRRYRFKWLQSKQISSTKGTLTFYWYTRIANRP